MRRRLFTIAAAASLVLCVGMVALWVRSWRTDDLIQCAWVHATNPATGGRLSTRGSPSVTLASVKGRFSAVIGAGNTDLPAGWQWSWFTGSVHWRSLDWPRFLWQSFSRPEADRIHHRWGVEAGLPHGLIAGGLAVLPAAWVAGQWCRRRRRPPHACRGCGYDLRATPARCPECGAVPAAAADR